uniref:BMERB domain-containing protein n=1 Tax=Macrostomum lignano TaxID=282301 RepID=A0A1I8I9D8_9PLAT
AHAASGDAAGGGGADAALRSCDDGAGSEAADSVRGADSVGDEATSEPLPDLGGIAGWFSKRASSVLSGDWDAGSSFGEEAEDSFLDESGGGGGGSGAVNSVGGITFEIPSLQNARQSGRLRQLSGGSFDSVEAALAPPSTDTPAAAAAAAAAAARRQQRQAGQQRRSLSVREGDRRTSRRPLNQLSADSVGLQPPQPQHQQQLSKARSISPAMMMRAASSGEEAADAEAKPKAEVEATTDEAVAESPMEAKAESAVELEDNCGSDEGRVVAAAAARWEAAEIELNSRRLRLEAEEAAANAAQQELLQWEEHCRLLEAEDGSVPGSVREAQLLAAIEEGRRLRERLDAEDAALDKRLDALQRLLSARRNQIRRQ